MRDNPNSVYHTGRLMAEVPNRSGRMYFQAYSPPNDCERAGGVVAILHGTKFPAMWFAKDINHANQWQVCFLQSESYIEVTSTGKRSMVRAMLLGMGVTPRNVKKLLDAAATYVDDPEEEE